MITNITQHIVLRSRPLASGLHSVILRLTHKKSKKDISLNLACKKSEFRKGEFTRQHPNYIKRNQLLTQIKSIANGIIDELLISDIPNPLLEFEKRFQRQISGEVDENDNLKVFPFFNLRIEELIKSGKAGHAFIIKDTRNSLEKFSKNPELTFKEMSYSFLRSYEGFLRNRDINDSGIAFKLREIRAIYNEAIKRGIARKEDYPFTDFKVSKFKSMPDRRALTKEELLKFMNIDISRYPQLLNSYNYFKFSFYTRGMNFYDIAKLTWQNIDGNNIRYTRSKTKVKFIIEILPPVREILDHYKRQARKSRYIFPIFQHDNYNPVQLENRKHRTLRFFNYDLKKLAQIAGIEKTLTSYVARHSYATILKFSGISTDIISESMGHSSLLVTQSYLKSFDNEKINEANRVLLDVMNIELS